MMLDWSQYRAQLLKAIGELGRLSPQTVRGHRELTVINVHWAGGGRSLGCGGKLVGRE